MTDTRIATAKDLFLAAFEAAKADERWDDSVSLDYVIPHTGSEKIEIDCYDFTAVCDITYGPQGGVFGAIHFFGRCTEDSEPTALHQIGLLKNINSDKTSYVSMHTLCGVICYYCNQYISKLRESYE